MFEAIPNYTERTKKMNNESEERVMSAFGIDENSRIISLMRGEKGKENMIYFTRMPTGNKNDLLNILNILVPQKMKTVNSCIEKIDELFAESDSEFVQNVKDGVFKIDSSSHNQEPTIRVMVKTKETSSLFIRDKNTDI